MKRVTAFINKHKKLFMISVCSFLAAVFTVGGVCAYLFYRTPAVANTMTKGTSSNEIKEDFSDKQTKKQVYIHNTGTVASYIRVKLVPEWEDNEGNAVAIKASLDDFNIKWGDDKAANWIYIDENNAKYDGYYYYKFKVPADDKDDKNLSDCTSILIKEAKVKTSHEGCHMNLCVLAESIQADPPKAVLDAWHKTVNKTDGTLS